TRIMEPLCDTLDRQGEKSRKTLDEHLEWVVNTLKLLVGEEAIDDCETLEEAIDVVNQLSPHFKFRTWKGDKPKSGPYKDREPQVQHVWMEGIEFEDDEEDDGVEEVEEVEDDEEEDDDIPFDE